MGETLSEGDRAVIKEIAREVAREMSSELKVSVQQMIRLHQAECPGASFPFRLKLLIAGIGIGSGALSAGIVRLLL